MLNSDITRMQDAIMKTKSIDECEKNRIDIPSMI